jgi:hypothetical protein
MEPNEAFNMAVFVFPSFQFKNKLSDLNKSSMDNPPTRFDSLKWDTTTRLIRQQDWLQLRSYPTLITVFPRALKWVLS